MVDRRTVIVGAATLAATGTAQSASPAGADGTVGAAGPAGAPANGPAERVLGIGGFFFRSRAVRDGRLSRAARVVDGHGPCIALGERPSHLQSRNIFAP